MGDLAILPHVSLSSFIHLNMDQWIFYTLGYNPMLLYFVAQIVPFVVTGDSSRWLTANPQKVSHQNQESLRNYHNLKKAKEA